MKKWVEKLIEQFDFDLNSQNGGGSGPDGAVSPEDAKAAISAEMNEERATLLYIIDTYNKHLIDVDGHPVRKVRETLDEFAKEILNPNERTGLERVLFRFRQFFSTYRVDETTYFHKTFEDFRTIIWDFVDQLSEDISQEQKEDFEIRTSLEQLKEAVESNSIDVLKNQSRKFIDCYVEKQFKKDKRRISTMKSIRKNLNLVKKQLGEAANSARVDHLTQAYNRKTFDEYVQQHHKLFHAAETPVTLMLVDIDHFKKINDTFGHQVGDFVLKELVGSLKSMFNREADLVARIGGEEFAILLPDYQAAQAMKKAEEVLARVRAEAYVHEEREIRFTVSIGVAQLARNEAPEAWIKRADLALYNSKNTGRNKSTLAPSPLTRVA
ncbi:MAG: GGDEF domain-containing protein [Bdellovibrionales bacterium]|nr:GGDEF domain-containing protein [Bdellovibrionales bacterium]